VVYQADARELSLNDGESVGTWSPTVGSNNLSATGDPTYAASAINGNPAVQYDGSNDYHRTAFSFADLTEPYTIFSVHNLNDSASGSNNPVGDDDGSVPYAMNDYGDSEYQWAAGSTRVFGSPDRNAEIFATVFQGDSTSEFRINRGSQSDTGDVGTTSLSGLTVGARGGNDLKFYGTIGFVEIHDGLPSNGLQTREDEIASDWGL
jgi:hypothetical protein